MSTPASEAEFETVRRGFGLTGSATIEGSGFLRSALPVSALTTEAFTTLALALSSLMERMAFPEASDVHVDRALCDSWFGQHVRPVGWTPPSPWDPLSGSFATADRSWIRTHANAPHHRAALLHVLGLSDSVDPVDPAALAERIAQWDAERLESAIVDAGGASAALRTATEWTASAPGHAVQHEPLIEYSPTAAWDDSTRWNPTPERPLAGLRVLDLTRVIAGPACTQVLAGLGADVLRVDPPGWDEPAVLPLVMAGKRSVRLDLRDGAERGILLGLLAEADVLVHGYRGGAMDGLGLSEEQRRHVRPGLVDVAERAYGWTGPWTERRGFDSLVQFSSGIAHLGMTSARAAEPVSLPVQALDWATGYLAATSVLLGLRERFDDDRGSSWRLSLARTAHTLLTMPRGTDDEPGDRPEISGAVVPTALGDIAVAESPIRVGRASLHYTSITTSLGVDAATWS
ncbi:CoA transferase [Microbacterium mangrovi]|uniref:CoA transferase n=1 Tax=Microbacterium mangrovi TaxID=1348253 RepID=UPI00068C9BBA|nr:CoA transferase [Microbacterium mangrovi]